jgi:hypothetical protein
MFFRRDCWSSEVPDVDGSVAVTVVGRALVKVSLMRRSFLVFALAPAAGGIFALFSFDGDRIVFGVALPFVLDRRRGVRRGVRVDIENLNLFFC